MTKQVYIPVKDYALKHNVSLQNVYQLIKRGKLVSKKIGSFILVKA